MSDSESNSGRDGLAGVDAGRLFVGSCFALISTSVTFAVIGAIMGPLKEQFILTNEQVGYIGGAALWGFTISIFVFGPLCDAVGMRQLLRLAFVCHMAGPIVMIFATGFWSLFGGALIIAMGNGLVEAACNPLVATVYPDKKTEKLNQFHVWFPGGIVIGGLLSFAFDKTGIGWWQLKLGMIILPTLVYGFLFFGQKFPLTERVQSGVSFGGMCKETFLRPLFLLLLACMMITASLELGPNRWLPAVYEAGGLPGILVLVWISGLMAVLRQYAGPVVHRLSPTGILVASSALAGIGLWLLSLATGFALTFAAATVFAVGVCYFWPTMLGVTSERVPKGGALALALLGGMGNVAVGLIAAPQMGRVADWYAHQELEPRTAQVCLQEVVDTFPALVAHAKGKTGQDVEHVRDLARGVLDTSEQAGGSLPLVDTENALRAAMAYAREPETDDSQEVQLALAAAAKAGELMGPADNYGGRMSFRWLSPFSLIILAVFAVIYLNDKAKGGYKAERLAA